MKVSINWLNELVDFKGSLDELVHLLNNKTIGTKEVTDKFVELDMKARTLIIAEPGEAMHIKAEFHVWKLKAQRRTHIFI